MRRLLLLALLSGLVGCLDSAIDDGKPGGSLEFYASENPPNILSSPAELPPPPALPEPKANDDANKPLLADRGESRLRAGMVLSIQVTGEPALSESEARIGSDGRVFLAWLGRIEAAGLTPIELAEGVRKEIESRRYLKRAEVDIIVKKAEGRRVYVLGRVPRPGALDLPFDRQVTLTQVIAQAGGLSTQKSDLEADPTVIRLIRTIDGERRMFTLNFNDIVDGQLERDVVIRDGDTIYVPAKRELTIFGSVVKPGRFPLTSGSRLRIDEVLALAGGFTELADQKSLLLVRTTSTGVKTYAIPAREIDRAQVRVTTGDTIIVPTRSSRRVYVSGSVKKPGGYPLDESDLTVSKVLTLAGGPTRLASLNSVLLIRKAKDGRKRVYRIPVDDILTSGDIDKDPIVQPGDLVYVPERIL